MTDEEKIRKCIELVWNYEEIYEDDDLINFQQRELGTYTQHNNILNKLNKYTQLEKENAELKEDLQTAISTNQQWLKRDTQLEEQIEVKKLEILELKAQIEDMQIMEYSNLYEQRKNLHKNLIDKFTEQLGIMDKEDDVLFSLKAIKSIINFIMELE